MAGKLNQTIGKGLQSVASGNRSFFVLEYKTATEKHKAGESQQIIVDYIELGRNPKCAVRFGESDSTVSRRHAAIVKEGDQYLIKNLSATNPTLINGRPVETQWYLNNGDEIQLSLEGPRIVFLTPANNKTSTIGFTRRMSLFARQALRPYRTQMRILAAAVITAIAVIIFLSYYIVTNLGELKPQLSKLQATNKEYADSLKEINKKNTDLQDKLKSEVTTLEQKIKSIKPTVIYSSTNTLAACDTCGVALKEYNPYIYYVYCDKLEAEYQGQRESITDAGWSGTGFIMDDGRFITARHVVEPWEFFDETDQSIVSMNIIVNNGGKIKAYFTAYSPDGTTLSFTSDQFSVDRSGDTYQRIPDETGSMMVVTVASFDDGTDWASYKPGKTGNIPYDNALSTTLTLGTTLYILGYPYGMSLQEQGNLKPFFSKSTVAQEGTVNNCIHVNDRNFDHGNSGGPVFAEKDGKYYVVGIISAGLGTVGTIVPISSAVN
ncbi:MAG: FHA domain-containing protein [Bacteroidota bacterium]